MQRWFVALNEQVSWRRWMWCRAMVGRTFQLTWVKWISAKVPLTMCSTLIRRRLENVTWLLNAVVNCATFSTCTCTYDVSLFFLVSTRVARYRATSVPPVRLGADLQWKDEIHVFHFLPRDASAERGYDIACVVRPSVRPSVTFRYRDHIGWNSSKVIFMAK